MTMTKTTTVTKVGRLGWRLAVGAAVLAAAPSMIGCQQRGDGRSADASKDLTGIRGEQFLTADEPRQMHRVLDAQAAAGARHDATLRACHFDAGDPGALNSLGEQKLDLMLADDDALPVAVYLDAGAAPADPGLAAARQQSVRVYLRDRGLTDNQVKVVDGRNAGTYAPAAPKVHAARAADAKAAAASQGGTAGGATVAGR